VIIPVCVVVIADAVTSAEPRMSSWKRIQ